MNHIDSVVTLPVIFADEVCCAAGFRHGVIKVTQGGREIEQPQLFHQLTDAAGGKARLKAGTIRIFKIVHIPGVRVAVGSAELRGKFHAVAVFLRIRPAAALAAINAHGRRHHGPFVVFAQALDVRALGHAQNERGEHRAADDVHEKPVAFFKIRQFAQNPAVLLLRGGCDCSGGFWVKIKHGFEIFPERAGKYCPHSGLHGNIFHL